ncbi:OLC1v1023202C1 [Oldenlandia corymbosa var. corymbosa]|uniref:OLC1v1023202C1 n=1 Tax=Oldenlandia corymbosa var. corymbosa TaxID=529605 RepID=A0AAV1C132_OLDCO|nr:OLC1v1023202C1 [Oldenlandia corymbosa var. corymbosa]
MLSEDLIWEIIKDFPVKELMRFKCVCRTWLSVITNPLFTRAYPGGSRGLIHIDPSSWANLRCCNYLHRMTFNGGGGGGNSAITITPEIVLNHIVWAGHWVRWKGYTNIVEGLICFYRDQYSWLYNITTREMVQLPDSTKHAEEEEDKYHFGFDPVNKLYKLLRIMYPNNIVEILAIGKDLSWRTVSHPPDDDHQVIESQSVCLDGVLCWMDGYGRRITAFDLVTEKFIFIPPPDHDDDKLPRESCRSSWKLMNFGQSIALTKPGFLSHIMRYCRGGDFWVEVVPEVRDLSDVIYGMALGELPSGKMLIYNHWLHCPPTLYIFDQSKREWEENEVTKLTWEQFRSYGCRDLRFENWFYFEENIISLTQLTSSNRKVLIGSYFDDDDDEFLLM